MQATIRDAHHCMNILITDNHPLDQVISFFEDSDPLFIYFVAHFMRKNKEVCGSETRYCLLQFLSVYIFYCQILQLDRVLSLFNTYT